MTGLTPTRRGRLADITDWRRQYQALTMTAEEAARMVRPGDTLVTTGGANWPYAVDAAVTIAQSFIPARLMVAGVFLISCLISLAIGTS